MSLMKKGHHGGLASHRYTAYGGAVIIPTKAGFDVVAIFLNNNQGPFSQTTRSPLTGPSAKRDEISQHRRGVHISTEHLERGGTAVYQISVPKNIL